MKGTRKALQLKYTEQHFYYYNYTHLLNSMAGKRSEDFDKQWLQFLKSETKTLPSSPPPVEWY